MPGVYPILVLDAIDQSDRVHRNSLSRPDPPHPLVGLALNRDLGRSDAHDLGQSRAYRHGMRPDSGLLRDHGHVEVHDLVVLAGEDLDDRGEQPHGVSVLPAGVTWRKMTSHISQSGGTGERVD